jgi:hypothetical protein
VLQSILELEMGRGVVEVIDLARTNLGFEVRELAISALALEPDALVMFCGNNWNAIYPPAWLGDREVECWMAALRTRGVGGLKECIVANARAAIRNVVREITLAYTKSDIPIHWIVPEFNLGDWHDHPKNAPYLPGRCNRDWIEACDKAHSAMRDRNFLEACRCAERMVELDQGLSSLGPAILGFCKTQLEDIGTARRNLELARDAEAWGWMSITTPRALASTQNILRDEASASGAVVIDLPRIFAEHLCGAIPGQELFLDYCHLTSQGIRVSMAAAASATLRTFKTSEVPWTRLFESSPDPPPTLEADARLLAALHNAHWAQPRETIRRLCIEALNASPDISKKMSLVAHLQSSRTPAFLSQLTEALLEVDSQAAQNFIFHESIQRYDKTLVDIIVDCLASLEPTCGQSVAELRVRDHSAARRPTNLLEFYYNSSAAQPEEACWAMPQFSIDSRFHRADYYRAYWRESRFYFVGERDRSLILRMIVRLSSVEVDRALVTAMLNNRQIWEGYIGAHWTDVTVPLPSETLHTGTNEITILWPEPIFSPGRELERIADLLAQGIVSPLRPVYGEIHAASVSAS